MLSSLSRGGVVSLAVILEHPTPEKPEASPKLGVTVSAPDRQVTRMFGSRQRRRCLFLAKIIEPPRQFSANSNQRFRFVLSTSFGRHTHSRYFCDSSRRVWSFSISAACAVSLFDKTADHVHRHASIGHDACIIVRTALNVHCCRQIYASPSLRQTQHTHSHPRFLVTVAIRSAVDDVLRKYESMNSVHQPARSPIDAVHGGG